jgi:hypothetical protein
MSWENGRSILKACADEIPPAIVSVDSTLPELSGKFTAAITDVGDSSHPSVSLRKVDSNLSIPLEFPGATVDVHVDPNDALSWSVVISRDDEAMITFSRYRC